MTPANQRHIERMLRTWKNRLALDAWRIDVVWDEEPDDEDAYASIECSDIYDEARLRFRNDFNSHDLFTKNRIIVHELMHIHFRTYGNAVRSIAITGNITGDARALWYDRCRDEEEGVVDRLANRFVELGGEVK